jgi:hypothetical protein
MIADNQRMVSEMKTNRELIDGYHTATHDYEAAKAGTARRLEAFTRLLVAERVLVGRLPGRHLVCWPHGQLSGVICSLEVAAQAPDG